MYQNHLLILLKCSFLPKLDGKPPSGCNTVRRIPIPTPPDGSPNRTDPEDTARPKAHSPGQHPAEAGPGAAADQEAHGGIRHGIPGSAYEQDNGGIEGVQLAGNGKERQ